MKTLISLFAALLCVSAANVQAEERIQHYAVEKPASSAEAITLMTTKVVAIKTVLEKKALDDADLEAIHEITYSLEAAVDALREGAKDKEEALDLVDEAVQALHYASENHEVEKTREWFAKLEPAAEGVKNVF